MVSKKKLVVLGAVITIAILIFLLVIYLEITNALGMLHPVSKINGTISVYGAIRVKGVATYDSSRSLVEYALFNYQAYNVTHANLTLDTYAQNPIFHIYLVNPGESCYGCLGYAGLYSSLQSALARYGLIRNSTSFENISINDLNTTENNSLIILSTGLIPATLLPDTGLTLPYGTSNITLIQLLDRGDYIIYVGRNFSSMIENGNIYVTPNSTLSALSASKLVTYPHTNVTNASLYFKNPTFAFVYGNKYAADNAISYTNITTSKTLIALSNYPSLIWQNSTQAASDLSKIIASRFWMNLTALGNYNINGTTEKTFGNATLFTTQMTLNNSAYAPNIINSSYSLIRVNASNSAHSQYVEFPFTLRYEVNGTLGVPSQIGYGTAVPIEITVAAKSSSKSFSINVVNRSLAYVYAFPLSFFNTSLSVIKHLSFGNLPTGHYYLASLVDINNRNYGSTLFYVPNLNITPTYANFKNLTFLFNVLSNYQAISNKPFTASVNGAYKVSGTINNGIINYTLPKDAVVGYGQQNIVIHILNRNYTISEFYSSPPGIPSIYIEFGIAAAVILLLNLVLRAPNREEYFIDIQSLPPTQKSDVSVTPDQIVNLFDTINYNYHWKYMPLTPEELKLGISSNIRVGNTPVSVTLQNTNEVLYKLSAEGKLVYIDEYYMPARWESASNHDVEYLAVFRKMRDFLVEHAILFTDIEQSAEADLIMTSKGVQIPIFIFSKAKGIRRIRVIRGKKAFIVFINSDTRNEFTDRLYNTYGKTSETLRLSIESGSVILIDAESLSNLLY